MKNDCFHPLDKLSGKNSYFMLEAMIPFVDYQTKRFLIIYIKFCEIRDLMNTLNNKELMSECGFDKKVTNKEDFISGIMELLPAEVRQNLESTRQMIKMMDLLNNTSKKPVKDSFDDASFSGFNTKNSSDNDILSSVMSILDEYDSEKNNKGDNNESVPK